MTTTIHLTIDEAAMLLELVNKSHEAKCDLPEAITSSEKLIGALERLAEHMEAVPILAVDRQEVR